MAAASSLLSEEQLMCSVCLEVFTEPVTTPCGHNFCNACIQQYWDSNDICQCPLCKRLFSTRIELQVNTFISELAARFKRFKRSTSEPCLPGEADVSCDICSGMKVSAIKSCLVCLTSLCEVHLEPHQRVAGLKSHTLINPVGNLRDKMCRNHHKLTELYCRTDQTYLCVLCIKTDHKGHNVVALEEEYEVTVAKKDETMAKVKKMMELRSERIREIESSVDASQREADKEIAASVEVFTDLIRSIEKSQAELVEVIEERHQATKQKAEDFIKELRMEITDLEKGSNELQQLSQSDDHHLFLQSFSTICSLLNKNRKDMGVDSNLSVGTVRGALSALKETVDREMEQLPEIKLKRIKEHAVEVTLDPDTAHCQLILSQDGKQVTHGNVTQNLPNNPKRFEFCEVLAKEGFTTGKFYFEVQVKGKTEWVVGVAKESIDRKGNTKLSVQNGFWTIGLDEGTYRTNGKITLKGKLQNVGVFVDYNKGIVSFYDVDSKSHIYSFTGCYFTEKLYPYFCPQENQNGANSAPLVITPVHR
ncbi:E3 ubiquitin-protein ligase TRIM39-like [Myripristis murdjan]|uniref:E3 ubiquitin-protein ligase TRIM39-like n=1 Tax=Myripristis murdjan TaxID=586833 RepID=A0A668AEC1_9TELE|nr:E3 ubiquitin-protein ligase TRIM39-like [Myripristis murdjan]